MRAYPEHPAAALLPMLEAEELERLAADIKANGLREPIVLYDGQVLDGRNRLAACKLAGVKPRYRKFDGADPVAYVLSANVHRRQLTIGQRAMIAVAMLPELEARARQRQGARTDLRADSPGGGRARDEAAVLVGVSPRSVSDAKRLAAELPEAAVGVRAGTRSLNDGLAELRDPKQYRRHKELEEHARELSELERRISEGLELARAVSRELYGTMAQLLAYREWQATGHSSFKSFCYARYGEGLFRLLSRLNSWGLGPPIWIAAELGVAPANPRREAENEALAEAFGAPLGFTVPPDLPAAAVKLDAMAALRNGKGGDA